MLKRAISALLLILALTGCNRDPNVAKRKYLENGNKYFERGQFKEALIMYRNALKRDPKFGEGYYRAALAELRLQRWMDAARDLLRAVELEPKNLDAHTRLANLFLNGYLGDKRRPKALLSELQSLSEKMTQRFPNSYDEARLRGYLALFNNDSKEALAQFERANRIKPYQPDLVLVYMQTLSATGQQQAGEQLAKELLEKQPTAMPIYDALFVQYVREKRTEDAEAILRQKAEKNPKVPDPLLQLAAHYYTKQEREPMLAALRRITSDQQAFPNGRLLAGDFFLRIQNYDLAMQEYKQGADAATKPKDKHDYQKRMVEVLVKQNKRDEAQQLIRDVLKEDPKDPEAVAIRASLSLLTGTKEELQSAINDLRSVVSRMPDNPVLRYNLGRALLARRDIPAARVEFEEAIKLRPDYVMPRITLAQIMLQNREFPKVIQMAQDILVYDPQSIPARLLRSRALIGMNEYKQARAELERTTQQFPELPEARLQIAALDLQDRNFKEAQTSFQKLYDQFRDPRALMGLVDAYVGLGQDQVALQLLRSELAKNPERVEYRVAIGNIAGQKGDYATAISEYRAVLDKLPRSSDLWIRLGDVYRRQGDSQQATNSFKKASELAPNTIGPYINLALMYEHLGQKDDAKPVYEQILRLEPNHPVALNNLAYMMAENGTDLDTALTMAQRARAQKPQDSNVADTLGWIYIKKNLADSAIDIFRELVQKEPDKPTYHYHLAMALYQKGDKVQAKRACETALRNRPEKTEEAKIRELMSKLG